MVFHSGAREWQRKVRQAELPLPLRLICSYRKPTKVPKEGERREGRDHQDGLPAFNYWLPKKGLGHLVLSALVVRLILLLFVACLKFRPRPASQIIQSLSLLGLIRFSARSNLSRRPKERLLLLWSTGTVLGGCGLLAREHQARIGLHRGLRINQAKKKTQIKLSAWSRAWKRCT